MSTVIAPRLKEIYKSQIAPALQSEFNFSNRMQIPTLSKIVVNMGVGEAAKDSKLIEGAIRDLAAITGQRPLVTKARKSIANFKLREGQPIGAHVTLRGDRMWEFMDRLLTVSLPRIRDFRGLSPKQFDGKGLITLPKGKSLAVLKYCDLIWFESPTWVFLPLPVWGKGVNVKMALPSIDLNKLPLL